MRRIGLTVVMALLPAAPLAAQAWDAPSFRAPTPDDDLGAYFVDPEGGDWGVVATWRQTGAINLGLRGGIIDADDVGVVLGAEAYDIFLDDIGGINLDAAWTLGFGATISDFTLVRIPGGVTVGGRLAGGDNWALVPYAHPRASIDIVADDDDTDFDLGFTVDLGTDLYLGNRWIVRGGVALVDYDAIGIGVAYRTGRGVAVSTR